MSELPIENLSSVLSEHADKPLNRPDLPLHLFDQSLERSVSAENEDLTFLLSGEASVSLFNRPDDEDPDHVIRDSSPASDDETLGPQIRFDPDRAWLKYQLQGGAKANGTLEEAGFTFDASTDHNLFFGSYRVHNPDETVQDALNDDLSSPRLIVDPEDVTALAPHEAVTMHARGTLDLSVSVRWSDVFNGSLSGLSGLVANADLLAVSLDVGAKAHCDIQVEDDFTVMFSRLEPGSVRAAVKRRDRHEISAGASVGITAQMTDPEQANEVLSDVLDALLGTAQEEVESILEAHTSLDDVSGEDLERLLSVLDRLGLDQASSTIEDVRKRISELEAEARDTLQDIVESEVEAGFRFEYSRVDMKSVLLEAVIDDDRLEDVHGTILRGNLRPVLTKASEGESVISLKRYFNEQTVEVSRSWGLGLSFGDMFSVGSTNEVEKRTVERRDHKGQLKEYSFTGTRFSKDDTVGATECHTVQLEASMRQSTAHDIPRGNEFSYRFTLRTQFREDDLSQRELSKWLDFAQMWRIIAPGGVSPARDRIAARAEGTDSVTGTYTICVPENALRMVIRQTAAASREQNDSAFGDALGEAMPWLEDYDPRQDPTQRRKHYGPLWANYLSNSAPQWRDLARRAAEYFRREGRGGLAHRESRGRNLPGAIGEIAHNHPQLHDRWNDFLHGAETLGRTMDGKESYEGIPGAFGEMKRLWGQSLYVRALGVYVLDLISQNPIFLRKTDRVFTVDYQTNGTQQIEVFGSK